MTSGARRWPAVSVPIQMVRVALLLSAALIPAQCNMYDVIEINKLPPPECSHGCAAWADVARARPELNVTGMWATSNAGVSGEVPIEAESYCAIPGMVGGRTGMAAGESTADVLAADAGSFCFCKGTLEPHYCVSTHGVPEQINLQIASSNTIVVGFVTFEAAMPLEPPVAEFGVATTARSLWESSATELQGVSHWYMEKSNATCTGGSGPCATVGRNYTMSFVKFHSLEHNTRYTYRVKSGGKGAVWSDTFTFRTPDADGGTTKLGIYGDMGVYAWNNMQNLQEDCKNGDIDAIVHMGDHVYYWAGDDNKRGDAYMNAWQPTLAECPWMPFLGNHEYNDADNSWRYVNQTWGTAFGQENHVGDVMPDEELFANTDTALGHFMTRHNLYAQGSHGPLPSGTSRWYSINIGSMHLVGLDLGQGGAGVGPGIEAENPGAWADREAKQIAWLKADLAAVDRKLTPWVMVTSHYPLYHTALEDNAEMSADWYTGARAEFKTGDDHGEFVPCENGNSCTTVRERVTSLRSTLDPILQHHGVDFYNAGHVHDYSTNWPMNTGVVAQRNYTNPQGTIHICEGNGGVPKTTLPHGPSTCGSEYCRIHTLDPAYGRWTIFNATVVRYEHIPNDPAHVDNGESWFVTADSHGGPFSG